MLELRTNNFFERFYVWFRQRGAIHMSFFNNLIVKKLNIKFIKGE